MDKKEFEVQAIKALANPDTAIDELWKLFKGQFKDVRVDELDKITFMTDTNEDYIVVASEPFLKGHKEASKRIKEYSENRIKELNNTT